MNLVTFGVSKILSNLMLARGLVEWIPKTNYTVLPDGKTLFFNPRNKSQTYGYVTTVWGYSVYGEVPSGIVVDIGASIGAYTLKVADMAEKVIAIEPNPETVELLVKNLRYNKINNVMVVETAASDRNGMAAFYITKQFVGEGHTMMPLHVPKERFMVPTVKLDSLLQKYPDIELVKMDVEGVEVRVLRGAGNLLTSGAIQKFSIAVYHYLRQDDEVRDILEGYGYQTRTKLFLDGDLILYAKLKR